MVTHKWVRYGFCREGASCDVPEVQVPSSLACLSLHPGFLGTFPDSQHGQRRIVWLVSP